MNSRTSQPGLAGDDSGGGELPACVRIRASVPSLRVLSCRVLPFRNRAAPEKQVRRSVRFDAPGDPLDDAVFHQVRVAHRGHGFFEPMDALFQRSTESPMIRSSGIAAAMTAESPHLGGHALIGAVVSPNGSSFSR